MYEDVSIELNTFKKRGKIFCIASAGCTAMQLAPFHDEIVAVDINSKQISYVQHRLNGGKAHLGKAEKFMSLMRKLIPLIGWKRCRLKEFLDLSDTNEQIVFWETELNTCRFRTAFDALFSNFILKIAYSQELINVLPVNPGQRMRERMYRCFSSHSNFDNPYLRAIFLGELNNFVIPNNMSNIHLVHSDAATYLEKVPEGSFDGFSISNVLDGTDVIYQRRLINAIKHAASEDALVLMRSFNKLPISLANNRAAQERSFLWEIVATDKVSNI